MTRAEQLQDQAQFLRSLARSSSISSKRDQLLRAAEQCEALADTFGHGRASRPESEPAAPGEPYLRIPARAH
jgi:hypothetical protein